MRTRVPHAAADPPSPPPPLLPRAAAPPRGGGGDTPLAAPALSIPPAPALPSRSTCPPSHAHRPVGHRGGGGEGGRERPRPMGSRHCDRPPPPLPPSRAGCLGAGGCPRERPLPPPPPPFPPLRPPRRGLSSTGRPPCRYGLHVATVGPLPQPSPRGKGAATVCGAHPSLPWRRGGHAGSRSPGVGGVAVAACHPPGRDAPGTCFRGRPSV